MSQPKLTLEILTGPLDGHLVTLTESNDWSSTGAGVLSFPWDEELGAPQARFSLADDAWWLEPVGGGRSTRHNGERVETKVKLGAGDSLKAANTWLQVKQLGEEQRR